MRVETSLFSSRFDATTLQKAILRPLVFAITGLVCAELPAQAEEFPSAVWQGSEGQDLFVGSHAHGEILGISKDGQYYAVRRYLEDSQRQCRYPKVSGRSPLILTLALCKIGQGCQEEWPVYGLESEAEPVSEGSAMMHEVSTRCRTMKDAKRSLEAAKSSIRKKGIELGKGYEELELSNRARAILVDKRHLKKRGLKKGLEVRLSMKVTRDGGRVTAHTALVSFVAETETYQSELHSRPLAPGQKDTRLSFDCAAISEDKNNILYWLRTPDGPEPFPFLVEIDSLLGKSEL